MIVKTLSSQFLAARRKAAITEYERILKAELWEARDQVMIYEGNLATVSMKPPPQDDKRFWYEELDRLRHALEHLKKRHADTIVAMEGNIYSKPAFRHFLSIWEEQHVPAEKDYVDVEISDKSVPIVPEYVEPIVPTVVVKVEPEVPTVVEVEPEVSPPKESEVVVKPEVSIEESVIVEPTPNLPEPDVSSEEMGHEDQSEKRVDTAQELGGDA
jgi:hypothetical protein